MDTFDKLTMEQAQQEMEIYKKVFTVVRLLTPDFLKQTEELNLEKLPDGCKPCYHFWNREKPCEECVSAKAFTWKTQKTKVEHIGSNIYQVTARYLEIDGKPYVMELIKCMDDGMLAKLEERNSNGRSMGYHEKLYRDVLTGAYNRRYYEEQIKTLTRDSGVAMLDLDDFKLYNDTIGHDAGDVVLVTIVNEIRKNIRSTDILIRYGGDEFLLLMPGINADILTQKLQKLQKKLNTAIVPGYSGLRLSVSIGAVVSGKETIEQAVSRADKFMYKAKNHKNVIVIDKYEISGDEKKLVSEDKNEQLILIVDDSEMNRAILSEMLCHEFRILEAENGRECVNMLEQYGTGISLILLDIFMPVMDGFEVLAYMTRGRWMDDIPVIMISSEDSEVSVRHAYEMGVSDYISRPFDAKVVYQRVYNTIKLYTKQRRLISLVADQIYEKEKNSQMLVGILSHIVEFRNGESGMHVIHIKILTGLLLERLMQKTDRYHITQEDQYLITIASTLHDIGKIGIDEKILNKPGRLTEEEFALMKKHTLLGEQIIDNLKMYQDEKLVKFAKEICRWHHERYDGRGYLDGLKGDEIPISAQVVSMADVYDALTSKRVYKDAYSHDRAMEMILNEECGVFNPLLLECLEELSDEIKDGIHEADTQQNGKFFWGGSDVPNKKEVRYCEKIQIRDGK